MILWLAAHALAIPGITDESDRFSEVIALEISLHAGPRYCTATVVAPRWVVTAASCVGDARRNLTAVEGPLPATGTARHEVTRVLIHPDFEPGRHDIAAVEVATDLTPEPATLDYGQFVGMEQFRLALWAGFGTVGSHPPVRSFADLYVDAWWDQPWALSLDTGPACPGDGGAAGFLYREPISLVGLLPEPPTDCVADEIIAEPIADQLPWLTDSGVPWTPTGDGRPGVHCWSPTSLLDTAPIPVECHLYAPDLEFLGDVSWTWDDGPPTTEPTHTYEDVGDYEIHACYTVDGDEECTFGTRVVVCGSFPEGLTLDPVEGLTVDIIDRSNELPYSCVQTVGLRIYPAGSDERLVELIDRPFRYTFPAEGDYDLELVATGPIWEEAVSVRTTVTVTELQVKKCGCTSAPGGGIGWVMLLGAAVLRRRRG